MSMQASAPVLGTRDASPDVSMASSPDTGPGVVVPEGSFAAAMVLARGGDAAFADAIDVLRAVWTNADLTQINTPDERGPLADARPEEQSAEANTLIRGSLALAESRLPSGQGSRLPASKEIQGHDPSPRAKQELAAVPLTVAIASALALVGLTIVGLRLWKQKPQRRKRTRRGPLLP